MLNYKEHLLCKKLLTLSRFELAVDAVRSLGTPKCQYLKLEVCRVLDAIGRIPRYIALSLSSNFSFPQFINSAESKPKESIEVKKLFIPLIFHILIEPSLEAVMICSELGLKHNHVTALCITIQEKGKKHKKDGETHEAKDEYSDFQIIK